MKIKSFIKRLNATELGLGVTNDTYIAIPSEVNLSHMLENQVVLRPFDRTTGDIYDPQRSVFKYVQTGQNNQERISGLGEYYEQTAARVGDEILVEKIESSNGSYFYLDLHHRNAIVFQVNKINGRACVEILPNNLIKQFSDGENFICQVVYDGKPQELKVEFYVAAKKKKTSPNVTRFYDLLINGSSILRSYSYQEYIELVTDGMRLGRMKTYWYSEISIMEDNDE